MESSWSEKFTILSNLVMVSNKYKNDLQKYLKNLKRWNNYQEFRMKLLAVSFGENDYFQGLIEKVYLRIPFNLHEREEELERSLKKKLLRYCKQAILRYLRKKKTPQMASFYEFKEKLTFSHVLLKEYQDVYKIRKTLKNRRAKRQFPDEILKETLKSLEKKRWFQRKPFVSLHEEVNFWGMSFPDKTCNQCAFFRVDKICSFWSQVRREDKRRISDLNLSPHQDRKLEHVNSILLARSKDHYNPRAHACFMFEKKPNALKRKPRPINPSKLLEELKNKNRQENDAMPKPLKLSASLFSKVRYEAETGEFHYCPASAALTLLGYDHYNDMERVGKNSLPQAVSKKVTPHEKFKKKKPISLHDDKKGTERHRLFKRITERMVRKFHKPGKKMTKQRINSRINELKNDFQVHKLLSWMQFDHLEAGEIEEFVTACTNYFMEKVEINIKSLLSPKDVLKCIYGGIPRAEEMILGTTLKGRADLLIDNNGTYRIVDMKNTFHEHHELQLAALAMAVEEREAKKGIASELMILTMGEREINGTVKNTLLEHSFSLTDELKGRINSIRRILMHFNVKETCLAVSCTDRLCDKRAVCTKEILEEFNPRLTRRYNCSTCMESFEQLECRGKFPVRGMLQCDTCRTSYKHTFDKKGAETILITPDIDHLLVARARELDVLLPPPRIYVRREVRVLYPGTKIDENLFKEGLFPVMENGEYPSLLNISMIIDTRPEKEQLSPDIMKYVKNIYNIRIELKPPGNALPNVHEFYDDLIDVVRKSESLIKPLTLANILSRYTFSRLALHLMGKDDLESELRCWKILDIYLHALQKSSQKSLLAMEAAAASIMWDLIKPLFNEKRFFIHSRMLERRVLDQYLFSRIKTAARTQGNVFVNLYFKQCSELARFIHAAFLLGWMGVAGLHHGRLRKTALDVMGLVVDLNENFKLIYLLELLKSVKNDAFTKGDIRAWIGTKRTYNYYLNWNTIDEIKKKCITLWEDDNLSKSLEINGLILEKETLQDTYEEHLKIFKHNCIQSFTDIASQSINKEPLIQLLEKIDELDEPTHHVIKTLTSKQGSSYEPFLLKVDKYPLPTQDDWNFFQSWRPLLNPLDVSVSQLIDTLYNEIASIFLSAPEKHAKNAFRDCLTRVITKSKLKFLTSESEREFISNVLKDILALFNRVPDINRMKNLCALVEHHVQVSNKYIINPIHKLKSNLIKELNHVMEINEFTTIEQLKDVIEDMVTSICRINRLTFQDSMKFQDFNSKISFDMFNEQESPLVSIQEFVEASIETRIAEYQDQLVFQPVLI